MTVFKGYMKIIKSNTKLIIMYIAIFMGITIMIQMSTKSSASGSYQAESVKIGVVDNDGGTLAKGLAEYLDKFHTLTYMEDDKEVLQENLFYENIAYVVKIPSGFEEKCLENNEQIPVTKKPGSYTSFYVDQQINSFMNNVKTYYAAGYSVEEALNETLHVEEPKITMLDKSGNAGETPGYTYYYQYVPYLMLCVLCYVLGNILSAFHKGDIPKRMQASAVPARRQNLEALLATGIFGIVLWLISVAGGIIIYRKEFLQSPAMFYYILNALIMLFVALAIAYMVGMMTNNANALSGIVNTLSLGMCFLCGVFVPMDILSSEVKTFSQFLPVYWYERVNSTLADFGTITGSVRVEVLKGMGIQLVFAVAIICVAMAISKKKRVGK